MRSASRSWIASISSLPNVTSCGDGKYVGDVWPQVPRMDATWTVMPIRSPARIRARLGNSQSRRPARACRKCAWTSTSGSDPASGAVRGAGSATRFLLGQRCEGMSRGSLDLLDGGGVVCDRCEVVRAPLEQHAV